MKGLLIGFLFGLPLVALLFFVAVRADERSKSWRDRIESRIEALENR